MTWTRLLISQALFVIAGWTGGFLFYFLQDFDVPAKNAVIWAVVWGVTCGMLIGQIFTVHDLKHSDDRTSDSPNSTVA